MIQLKPQPIAKMNTPAKILAVTAGIIALSFIKKGSALKTLTFFPSNIRGISFDGVTPVLKIGLAIQNTSNQRMILKSFAGEVSANGFYLGNVSNFLPVAINPNTQTVLPLNIRLSLIGIVQDIINAVKGQGTAQLVKLNATANIDNIQLPINIDFKIG